MNAGIIDQRLTSFVSRHRLALHERLGAQAASDDHKTRSGAFALMCLQALLQLDDDAALDSLTDGGNDLGIDAIHIGDVIDGEFIVTIANSKYSKSLDATSGFPQTAITRVIATTQRLFDPGADLQVHPRLEELVTEIRALIIDGNIPEVRIALCNNGKTWEANGQTEIDASRLANKRVSFHYVNHDKLVELFQRKKSVDALLHLSGKAIVDDFDYRRVLVGRLPVTEVKKLFDTYGDALLDRNIRRYLGLKDNRVNLGIHTTLLDDTKRPNFYFFNNGITAICSKFTHNALQEANWDVQIVGLQIVNGGQTSKTIQKTITEANSTDFSTTFVLFRLYELASAEDDVLVNQITFATNSQNPVDLTDLRSNDATQERLAVALKDLGFEYKRKRDDQVVSSTDVITSAVAAEAVMAAWRRRPNAAKFRRSKLFSDYYDDVFADDLQASHVVLAVQAFRLVENERKRPTAKRQKYVPYASHFLSMVVLDVLLRNLKLQRSSVTHKNLADIRKTFDLTKGKLYREAVTRVGAALRKMGIRSDTPLPRVAAQFRRGDLLEPLQEALTRDGATAGVTHRSASRRGTPKAAKGIPKRPRRRKPR